MNPTVHAVTERIRQRSAALRQAYLARIERVNPGLNALISLKPPETLLAEARQMDELAAQDCASRPRRRTARPIRATTCPRRVRAVAPRARIVRAVQSAMPTANARLVVPPARTLRARKHQTERSPIAARIAA